MGTRNALTGLGAAAAAAAIAIGQFGTAIEPLRVLLPEPPRLRITTPQRHGAGASKPKRRRLRLHPTPNAEKARRRAEHAQRVREHQAKGLEWRGGASALVPVRHPDGTPTNFNGGRHCLTKTRCLKREEAAGGRDA